MRCEHFLETYSDFRDGIVTDEARADYERHMAECGSCRRYDHVVSSGVAACAELPAVEVSHDFLPRLQHRIYHLEDAARLTTGRAVGAAALAAVAGVGFLAVTWLPFATEVPIEVHFPPMAVEAPASELADDGPRLFRDGPHLAPAGAFYLMPNYPTLDESSDLFTTSSLRVEERSYRTNETPATGQFDSDR